MDQTEINKELLSRTWSGSSVSEREGQAWDKKKEMDFTYTNIDKFIRYSLGENPVFSNAMYLGDFSMSLEEAQRRKHEFVANSLNVRFSYEYSPPDPKPLCLNSFIFFLRSSS